jgi:Zn-dependent protease with chaperone function
MKKNKLLSRSFWLIMAIHLTVFTAIGFFSTKGWRLLVTFLAGLGILILLFVLLRLYSRRHPEKKRLAAFLASFGR